MPIIKRLNTRNGRSTILPFSIGIDEIASDFRRREDAISAIVTNVVQHGEYQYRLERIGNGQNEM